MRKWNYCEYFIMIHKDKHILIKTLFVFMSKWNCCEYFIMIHKDKHILIKTLFILESFI